MTSTPRGRDRRALAEGRSNAEIAKALDLSLFTVKNHVSNILMKLHVRSRTEAAAFILRPGLNGRGCSSSAPPPRSGATSLMRLWTVPRGRRTVDGRATGGPVGVSPRGVNAREAGHVGSPATDCGGPCLIVFVVNCRVWVLFFATGTSSGAAIDEPGEFVVTLLDGLTFAGLMFVVASGFTLIFGLMRTVNMAHGALFLLAAYIAIDVQQKMVGKTTQHRTGGRQRCSSGSFRCSSGARRRRSWASSSSRCSCAGTRARISARR